MCHFSIAIALSTLLLISICSAQQPAHKAVLDLNRDNRILSDSALLQTDELTSGIRVALSSYGMLANGSPAPLIPSSPDNWNGGTGNWSNGANWNNGVPGATSDVTIYSGGN